MSAKTTTRLEAVIRGHRCFFDGFGWSSSDPALAEKLNLSLAVIPLPLIGLFEVAEEVIHRAGESATARIIRVKEEHAPDAELESGS